MSAPHVNKSTPCADCGHAAGDHCASGRTHWDAEEHLFSCIAQHCICGPCRCPAFVNPFTGKIAPWTRPTLPETPCARCGHPNSLLAGKVQRELSVWTVCRTPVAIT